MTLDDDFDDDYEPAGGPWCKAFDDHKASHRFCVDHQASWCRVCDRGTCPQCVDDPHCPDCHCAIFDEEHDWDCMYAE